MNSIELPVEVAQPSTGMAQAMLTEMAEHLQLLAEQGKTHVIDLMSLPLNDTDKRELQKTLGEGEVAIKLHTIGDSEIKETAYSGIWWIKHYSTDGQTIAELIEVCEVPAIIKSHVDDIRQSASALQQIIDNDEIGDKHE